MVADFRSGGHITLCFLLCYMTAYHFDLYTRIVFGARIATPTAQVFSPATVPTPTVTSTLTLEVQAPLIAPALTSITVLRNHLFVELQKYYVTH